MSRPSKRHSEENESQNTGSKQPDRSPPESPKRETCKDDTKKMKLMLSSAPKPKGIHIKLGGAKNPVETKPKITVASVFNQDSDSEPEEMPPEARMRMRNIGRNTPTSAGPNSFGKTKHGFCDAKKVFEKNLKEAMNNADRNDG